MALLSVTTSADAMMAKFGPHICRDRHLEELHFIWKQQNMTDYMINDFNKDDISYKSVILC